MSNQKEVNARSYTLRTETGQWLGQIVLTSDGLFASVTDYGNLSYAWRAWGDGDFRKFICGLNVGYFGTKMYTGMSYILYGKKCEKACHYFAEKILPALQKTLKEELANEQADIANENSCEDWHPQDYSGKNFIPTHDQ